MTDVVVGERVHRLLAQALPGHEPRVPQNPKVLRDERLRRSEMVHEVVDTARSMIEHQDDGEPMRRSWRAPAFGGVTVLMLIAQPVFGLNRYVCFLALGRP